MIINFNKNSKFNTQITKYFNKALRVLNITEAVSVDMFFVSKHKIKSINNKFRNKNKVTDVLSFPSALKAHEGNMQVLDWEQAKLMSFDPTTKHIFLGDIMLCMSVAKKQAREYGHGLEREVCYLAVHGLLHLLGYDHLIENEKIIMRKLEEEILKD